MTKVHTNCGRDIATRLHPLFDLVREIEALGLDTRPPRRKSAARALLYAWRRLTALCMRNLEL